MSLKALIYFIFCSVTAMLVVTLLISCKKEKRGISEESSEPVKYTTIELPCDTFSQRYSGGFASNLINLTVHKSNPSVIVYSLHSGTRVEVRSLNLNTNKDILLVSLSFVEEIDLNKYGELIIAGGDAVGAAKLLLGRYDDPGSFKKVSDEDFYGIINADWLNDGNLFTYRTTYSNTPPIIFRDRNGKKLSEKQFTDSIMAVLDEVAPGKWLTTSYVINNREVHIGTCDTSLNDYHTLFKTNNNSLLKDVEYDPSDKKLLVIPANDGYLFRVDIESGKFEPTPVYCENIIISDIDYCSVSGEYYLCLWQAEWVNGNVQFRQYLCKSKLVDRKVEILKEIK